MSECTEIEANVKISGEVDRVWFTVSYNERRTIQPGDNVDQERKALQDFVYDEVCDQMNPILGKDKLWSNRFKKKGNKK